MERLTEWRNGHGAVVNNQENYIDKLARYEDAEEQGRLIVLPCKLWDTLYDAYTGDIRHHYVTEFSTRGKDVDIQVNDYYAVVGCYCHASDIGKTVFLSREEAEKALEGMK